MAAGKGCPSVHTKRAAEKVGSQSKNCLSQIMEILPPQWGKLAMTEAVEPLLLGSGEHRPYV